MLGQIVENELFDLSRKPYEYTIDIICDSLDACGCTIGEVRNLDTIIYIDIIKDGIKGTLKIDRVHKYYEISLTAQDRVRSNITPDFNGVERWLEIA